MRMYSDKEIDKMIKKCRRQCFKEKKGDLEEIINKFSYRKPNFSNYDSYFACRMLLVEFFNKKVLIDYLEFIKDIALEHIEPQDLKELKEFLQKYIRHYRLLWRVLENVSITE
jgi:hypothetical protein